MKTLLLLTILTVIMSCTKQAIESPVINEPVSKAVTESVTEESKTYARLWCRD